MKTKACGNDGAIEQVNEREGETATLLSASLVSFQLARGGFAPRYLGRWIACALKTYNDLC